MKNSKNKFLYTCMLSILFISSFNTSVWAADPKLVTTLDNAFEKMYSKNLTKEEKSMIRLAYFMGKTNQFTDKK